MLLFHGWIAPGLLVSISFCVAAGMGSYFGCLSTEDTLEVFVVPLEVGKVDEYMRNFFFRL